MLSLQKIDDGLRKIVENKLFESSGEKILHASESLVDILLSYQGHQIDTHDVEGRALAAKQNARESHINVDAVVDTFCLSMDTALKWATERKDKSISQTQQLQRQHILLCFLTTVWTLSVHLSQRVRQRQLFVVVMDAQKRDQLHSDCIGYLSTLFISLAAAGYPRDDIERFLNPIAHWLELLGKAPLSRPSSSLGDLLQLTVGVQTPDASVSRAPPLSPLIAGVVKACSRELDILMRACTSRAQQQAAAVQYMQTVRKATLTFVLALSHTDVCEVRMHTLTEALLLAMAPFGDSYCTEKAIFAFVACGALSALAHLGLRPSCGMYGTTPTPCVRDLLLTVERVCVEASKYDTPHASALVSARGELLTTLASLPAQHQEHILYTLPWSPGVMAASAVELLRELGLPPGDSSVPDEDALPRCNTLLQAIATEWMYLAPPQYLQRVDYTDGVAQVMTTLCNGVQQAGNFLALHGADMDIAHATRRACLVLVMFFSQVQSLLLAPDAVRVLDVLCILHPGLTDALAERFRALTISLWRIASRDGLARRAVSKVLSLTSSACGLALPGMHLGAIHLLAAMDTPTDDVPLVAALVLAEEAETRGAPVGDFIAFRFLPGLLTCLREFTSSPDDRVCASLHELIAALLPPLLKLCAQPAPSEVDWSADWAQERVLPTTADLLGRVPSKRFVGLQQRLDACAVDYISCSAELATEMSECGSGVAAATRALVVPLLRSRDAHLNALALLLTSRVAAVARDLLEDRDVAARYVEVCAPAQDANPDADTQSSRAPQDAIAVRAEAARVLSAIAFEVVGSARDDLLPTTLRQVTRHCGITVEKDSHNEPLAFKVRTQLLRDMFASLFLSPDAGTMPSRRRLFLASECIALESHIATSSPPHRDHEENIQCGVCEEGCDGGEIDKDVGDDDLSGGAGGGGDDDNGCDSGHDDDGEESVSVGRSGEADVSGYSGSRTGMDLYDGANNSVENAQVSLILSRL